LQVIDFNSKMVNAWPHTRSLGPSTACLVILGSA
jgi:hypothetical protein